MMLASWNLGLAALLGEPRRHFFLMTVTQIMLRTHYVRKGCARRDFVEVALQV